MSALITRSELAEEIDRGAVVVVETLGPQYFEQGHLPGAINIPHTDVAELAPSLLPDRDAAIVVYCSNTAMPELGDRPGRLAPDGLRQRAQVRRGQAGLGGGRSAARDGRRGVGRGRRWTGDARLSAMDGCRRWTARRSAAVIVGLGRPLRGRPRGSPSCGRPRSRLGRRVGVGFARCARVRCWPEAPPGSSPSNLARGGPASARPRDPPTRRRAATGPRSTQPVPYLQHLRVCAISGGYPYGRGA